MEIEEKLFAFIDAYQISHLLDPVNIYRKQEEIVAKCRALKRPFLASMPVRHRFKCEVCGIEMGEVELHFEDPSQPIGNDSTFTYFGSPAGQFLYTDLSTIHGVLVHGKPMAEIFHALFANVRT